MRTLSSRNLSLVSGHRLLASESDCRSCCLRSFSSGSRIILENHISNQHPPEISELGNSNESSTAIRDFNSEDESPMMTIGDGTLSKEYEKEFTRLIFNEESCLDDVHEALSRYNQMIQDGIEPTRNHYYSLISGCSRHGLVKEAFELFDRMAQDPNWTPYAKFVTIFFQSCLDAPGEDRSLAREKATFLRTFLKDRHYRLNQAHYFIMVKTFAKLGDLKSAFELAIEMKQIRDYIIGQLLTGSMFDHESGFSFCIRVLRIMEKLGMKLGLSELNLALRCAASCGVGSREHLEFIAKEWVKDMKKLELDRQELSVSVNPMINLSGYSDPSLDDDFDTDDSELFDTAAPNMSHGNIDALIYDFLNYKSLSQEGRNDEDVTKKSTKLDLETLRTPENRLELLGGPQWVFDTIHHNRLRYSIITMAYLLSCLPNTIEEETEIYRQCERLKMKFEIHFFNEMLRRRSLRAVNDRFHEQRFVEIDDVLKDIQSRELSVNAYTFAALAPSCNTRRRAMKLISDMKEAGLSATLDIVKPLVTNACNAFNGKYLRDVLTIMDRDGVQPDSEIIDAIEKFQTNVDKILIEHEKRLREVSGIFNQPNYVYHYNDFKSFYKGWLMRHNIEDRKDLEP